MALTALIVLGAREDIAGAQTSVAPVLSCGSGMALDSASGTCLTKRTETVLRPSSCAAGSTMVGGEYGGHVCQTRVTNTVDTGRTQQIYSHTTYAEVWISTGTETVQTGTNRVWVPPIRIQTGSTRRCDFDPVSGAQFNCRNVPVYGYQTSHTATIPGYWSETPVYGEVETGYWDRVPTIHYTTVPVYETVVEWVTSPATQGSCGAGWQAVGSQCQRTVLGQPSASAQQSCPAGSVPRYGDSLGGTGPSVLTCQSSSPGSDTDAGTEQEDGGGPSSTPDGDARPLHHLAGESDERLAELGIHRCSDGLLSYVPCDELPGRTWDSDAGICDDIDGTTYRPDHGGSCVTESDLLTKCTTRGDCDEAEVRTYCPAIGELSDTAIQEHAHPDRGAETYRVCVFDCADFGTLPQYVQIRINGSHDYACEPVPEPDATEPAPSTTTTTSMPPTTTEAPPDDDDDDDDTGGGQPEGRVPDENDPEGEVPPRTTLPPPRTTLPPQDDCASTPPGTAVAAPERSVAWRSYVRTADARDVGPQAHMPGDGRYLQVAPGRGWLVVDGSLDVAEGACSWTAAWVRNSWAELRPWLDAERRAMQEGRDTSHLVERWDGLSAAQQELVIEWYRPGVAPSTVDCAVLDVAGAEEPDSCGWLFRHPGAYAWSVSACYWLDADAGQPGTSGIRPSADDECWVSIADGVDWIRSVSDYANGRVTVSGSGGGS